MVTLSSIQFEHTNAHSRFSKTTGLAEVLRIAALDLQAMALPSRPFGLGIERSLAASAESLAGLTRSFDRALLPPASVASLAGLAKVSQLGDALKCNAFLHDAASSIVVGSNVADFGLDVNAIVAPFRDSIAHGLAEAVRGMFSPPKIDLTGLTSSLEFLRSSVVTLHHRRVEMWLRELGSGDDPTAVEMLQVDGSESGEQWAGFWIWYLGQRVDEATADRPAVGAGTVVRIGDTLLFVWGLRMFHDDTDSFVEIRYPPWGTGKPAHREIDPFRLAASQRVLKGLPLVGYGRRRGRKRLADVWERSDFHRRYLEAKARAINPQPGRPPRQLDIALEMGMSDKHLRNLIRLHGLPDEKRS